MYLPAKHTPETEKLLEESRQETLAFRPAPMIRTAKVEGKNGQAAAEGEAGSKSVESLVTRHGRADDRDGSDDEAPEAPSRPGTAKSEFVEDVKQDANVSEQGAAGNGEQADKPAGEGTEDMKED